MDFKIIEANRSNIKQAGELFDLSVPTWNNKFGNEHIIYVMMYGFSFPLEKFINELLRLFKAATLSCFGMCRSFCHISIC